MEHWSIPQPAPTTPKAVTVKRKGPAVSPAPDWIWKKPVEKHKPVHKPVQTFFEAHLERGTLQHDYIYSGNITGRFASRGESVRDSKRTAGSLSRLKSRGTARPANGFVWTADEIDELRKYTNEGKSCTEIAKLLNRSIQAVINKRYELGLSSSRVRWTQEEQNTLEELYRQGLTPSQIGKQIHKSPSSVRSRLCYLREKGRI